MSVKHSRGTKRPRHVGVRNASHVYKSMRADGKWSFEVRHPANDEGKRLFEVVPGGLAQAKARAREVHGTAEPQVTSVATTLDDVVASWRASRTMRASSAAAFDRVYRVHIRPRLGKKKVREINKLAVQAWLKGLRRKDGRSGELAPGTQRMILAVLQMILAHAVDMGAIGAVPKLPKGSVPKAGEGRTRILTHDEESRLLAYTAPFPWLRPLIIVALYQGLRLGEAMGLQWADVKFTDGKLVIRHSLYRDGTLGPTKGGKPREIDLMPATRAELLELRGQPGCTGEGFVFCNSQGGPRQVRHVQRMFGRVRDRAALEGGICFHSLRHTCASRLANHPDIPVTWVRDFLGHSSLAVTMGYMHAVDEVKHVVNAGAALSGRTA
jgi:integrase